MILLSIFFSGEGGVGSTLLLLGARAAGGRRLLRGARRRALDAIRADLLRLQDTTAQIRVRGAVVLLVGFAAIADRLGLETILGAFIAGAVLSLVDRDEQMTHPQFRRKLEAVGFGVFIPVFFVTSGVNFDVDALVASASNVLMVPIFLAALVVVRGVPALPLPRAARRAPHHHRGADAGHLAAVHRRRDRDRPRARTCSPRPREPR